MRIYKARSGILIEKDAQFFLTEDNWDLLISNDNIVDKLEELIQSSTALNSGSEIIGYSIAII